MPDPNARIVSNYLKSLQTSKGRTPKSPAQITAELNNVSSALQQNRSGVAKLKLIQKQLNLKSQLITASKRANQTHNKQSLEKDFIRVAADYSKANGISNTAWRRMGVSGDILKAAGIVKARQRRM